MNLGSGITTAGVLAGALSLGCLCAAGVGYFSMITTGEPPMRSGGRTDTPPTRLSPEDPDPSSSTPPSAAAAEPPSQQLPAVSTSSFIGTVTVVDVAAGIPSLAKELTDQRTAAASHRQKMVVELVTASCPPCQGVSAALGDTRMQKALDHVRLVRIDRDQFEEDLDELEIPSKPWPSFFLLDADLRVKDAVGGDEWDADIAANIAPVLGPFLRGTYTKRRTPWRAPRPSGTLL